MEMHHLGLKHPRTQIHQNLRQYINNRKEPTKDHWRIMNNNIGNHILTRSEWERKARSKMITSSLTSQSKKTGFLTQSISSSIISGAYVLRASKVYPICSLDAEAATLPPIASTSLTMRKWLLFLVLLNAILSSKWVAPHEMGVS